MSNFKKAFTITVSVLTVLWSVGVAFAPSGVSAAAAAGDLIKMAGNPAVYYLGSDGKRYVFPTQSAYMSWYKDFSGVKTIPSSELASYLLGGNISIRPGTKLVKITTDPRVYAVEPGGMLRHISSEAIAMALYGANWNQRVVDVPDQFFANSYKYGSAITSNVHPTGSIVKYASGSTLYYVDNGVKRPFASAAAEAANMVNAMNAITTTITYPDGSSITAMDSTIWNVTGGSSSTPTSSAGLTVAAGSMTASTSLPKGANSVKVGDFNFTAGPEGAVMLSSVTFKRSAVGTTSDISNAYIYDGANRLTSGRTFNSSSNEATFALNVSVPAGSTKMLSLYVSISTTANSGDEHVFSVESASKVSSNATAVNGTFPVASNKHSIAGASAGTLSIQKSGSVSNPRVGDKMVKLSEFRLDASTEDAWVNQVTLYQGGSVANSALSNFVLKQNGTTVATASAVASNSRLALVFSPAFKIEKGNNRIFELFADVAGRPNDTVGFYIEDAADAMSTGGTYGTGMTVSVNANIDAFTDTGISLTLQGGQFTIVFDGPASANISNAVNDAVVWKGTLYSANAVEVRHWRFRVQDTNAADPDLSDASPLGANQVLAAVQDVKVWNLDNNTVIAGPKELTVADDNQSEYLDFTDTYNLAAGSTTHIGVSVDIKNQPVGNMTLLVSMSDAAASSFTANDIKNVDSNTYLTLGTDIVPSTSIAGQNQTVTAATLTVSTAPSPTDNILIKGGANMNVTSFNFAAGSGSTVRVTNIAVTGGISGTNDNTYGAAGAADTSAALADVVLSAKLMDGATQVGLTKSFVSGVATFDSLNWNITASQTKRLDLFISTNSAATLTGGEDWMRFSIGASGVSAVDADGNSVSGASLVGLPANAAGAGGDVVVDTKSAGSLTSTIAPTPTNPSASLMAAGSTDRVFAAYKFQATDDSFLVKKFTLISSSAAANARIAQLKVRYPAQDGTTKVQTVGLSGVNNLVDISAMPMYVAQNGSANLEVLGDVAQFVLFDGSENGTNAAGQLAFTLDGDNSVGNNQATGVGANTDSNGWGSDAVGNTHQVYRTILSGAAGAGTPNNTTRTRQAGQKVLSLNLSAGSNSNAFIRGSRKAPDGSATGWTATGGGTAATIATAGNFISGASAITTGAGTANTAGTVSFDFGATPGLTVYSRLSAWVKITLSAGASTATLSHDDTAALASPEGNSSAITADGTWQYVDMATTGILAGTRYVGVTYTAAGAGNTVTVTIDDMRFYNDSINLDVAGSLTATATAKGLLFTLKDSAGTVRAHGAFNGVGGTSGAGTVHLIAGNGADVSVSTVSSDIEASSTTLALDVETNTVTLVADVASVNDNLSVSTDTGTTTSAGDFRWYDNSDSSGSNDMAPATVVSPTSTTITFANSY